VIMDINMLHLCMEVVHGGQLACGLIIAIQWCVWLLKSKELFDELTKPYAFFCSMHCCNILSFGSQKCDDFLLLRAPQNDTTIDQEGVA
jgi:hypothetical protein